MAADDLSQISSLELVRKLIALVPDGSHEQAQLFSVVKGLSTAGFTDQFRGGKRWQAGGEGEARHVLVSLLPRLAQHLPGNPLVAELVKRYGPTDAGA